MNQLIFLMLWYKKKPNIKREEKYNLVCFPPTFSQHLFFTLNCFSTFKRARIFVPNYESSGSLRKSITFAGKGAVINIVSGMRLVTICLDAAPSLINEKGKIDDIIKTTFLRASVLLFLFQHNPSLFFNHDHHWHTPIFQPLFITIQA